jgi:hypothetical protein
MRKRQFVAAFTSALVLAFAASSFAFAASSHRTVTLFDNCDPASFDAVLGAGACVREGGGLKFDKFVETLLSRGSASSWKFTPSTIRIEAGGTITARNKGGEFHTFSKVAAFGGGCVAEVNALLGLAPVPECLPNPGPVFAATGVAPGTSRDVGPIAAGRSFYQCLIHPWQRVTVTGT